jgi:hypothetical protein
MIDYEEIVEKEVTSIVKALPILVSIDGIVIHWIADDHPRLADFQAGCGGMIGVSEEWLVMWDEQHAVVSEAARDAPLEDMFDRLAEMMIAPDGETIH